VVSPIGDEIYPSPLMAVITVDIWVDNENLCSVISGDYTTLMITATDL